MKNLTIIILLILVSCKSETKTEVIYEDTIDQSVTKIWNNFIQSNPEYKNEDQPDAGYFHNNKKDANRLAQLIVNGKKKAGSSLYAWYKDANADLQKIGTKSILTDFNGRALAILEITKVDTIPFNKITSDYAQLDMGTTINPLEKWKKAHWDFFESTKVGSEDRPTEDMLIVCEWFEVIWKHNSNN